MAVTVDAAGWVTGTLPGPDGNEYAVEKHEVPRTANQPFLHLELTPPNLVLHTTEGDHFDSAIATLTADHDPAQWLVGEGRIGQCRPLWAQGAAVDTENGKAMQIEIVGHSQLTQWLPDEPALFPLVALVAWLDSERRIQPLVRAGALGEAPLVLDRGPQATDAYYRRHLGVWPSPGVYGHVDLPNDEHWDPGSFDYPAFFQMIRDLQGGDDVRFEEWRNGFRRRIEQKGPPGDGASEDMKAGFDDAMAIFDAIKNAGVHGGQLPKSVKIMLPQMEVDAPLQQL